MSNYIDANVILRYLLKDDQILFEKAKNIIEHESVFVLNEVVAEIVYVLTKVYKIPKKEVSEILITLFSNDNFLFHSKKILFRALKIFSESSIDFIDSISLQ